jgi:tetratricopeptide (TPR) repeat protein
MRQRKEKRPIDPVQDPEEEVEPGALIAFIRWLRGWLQKDLAREARMDPSQISRYEAGDDIPRPANMDRILEAGGLGFPLVAAIKSFIRLIRRALGSADLMEATSRGPARPLEDVQRVEASLRRAQRRFPEAIKLHDQALEVTRPDQRSVYLLNKSATLEAKGDYEASIEVLREAASLIVGQRESRLFCVLSFNLAANLVRLSRAQEAMPIVEEVRALAERLQNDLDLVRVRWLEGNALAGLGRRAEAIAALEEVGRAFVDRELPFDYALASLDLAQVYLREGRLAEVQELAVDMVKIFEALGVQREAIAAVILFRDAAGKGAVTGDLVQRLQEYLQKARVNPKLRFPA